MTSEDGGVQLFDGEGSGYSRIGNVPEANQNILLVVTSQKTYDLMAADPKIKILQLYDEKTKTVTDVCAKSEQTTALAECKVSARQMSAATDRMR